MIEVIHVTPEEYSRLKNVEKELERVKSQLEHWQEQWKNEREKLEEIAALPMCPGQEVANKYLWERAGEKA